MASLTSRSFFYFNKQSPPSYPHFCESHVSSQYPLPELFDDQQKLVHSSSQFNLDASPELLLHTGFPEKYDSTCITFSIDGRPSLTLNNSLSRTSRYRKLKIFQNDTDFKSFSPHRARPRSVAVPFKLSKPRGSLPPSNEFPFRYKN